MTEYDFIVIGAGSAGCAVAGRLATESSESVLLIEAGGSDRRLTIRAPLFAPMQYGTSLDWAYETESEPGCAGRRIAQPRGRVLGGCSAMNASSILQVNISAVGGGGLVVLNGAALPFAVLGKAEGNL